MPPIRPIRQSFLAGPYACLDNDQYYIENLSALRVEFRRGNDLAAQVALIKLMKHRTNENFLSHRVWIKLPVKEMILDVQTQLQLGWEPKQTLLSTLNYSPVFRFKNCFGSIKSGSRSNGQHRRFQCGSIRLSKLDPFCDQLSAMPVRVPDEIIETVSVIVKAARWPSNRSGTRINGSALLSVRHTR